MCFCYIMEFEITSIIISGNVSLEVERWFAAHDAESRWRRMVTVDTTVKLKIVPLYLCDVPMNLLELR